MTAPALQRRSTPSPDTTTEEPVQRAARAGPVQRRAAMPVQYLLTVGRPDDPLEQQAEGLAARVQTASAPVASAGVQRAPDGVQPAEDRIHRVPASPPSAGVPPADAQIQRAEPAAGVQRTAAEVRRAVTRTTVQPAAAVRRAATGTPARPSAMSALPATGDGRPMPPAVRSRIEPHLGASLDTVRVHSGPDVDRAAAALQARAFTHRDQIFLGRRESPDDIGLMAHEAAHVVQQGAAAERVQLLPEWFTDATDAVVELGEDAVDAVVDFGTDVLRSLPGYDLMSLIAGRDLITGRPVAPDPATIARAVIRLHPLGGLLVHALDEIGILVPAAELIAAQLAAHDLNGARIVDAAATAIRELGADPLRALWNDVVGFATSVAGPLLDLIKETAVRLAERLLPGPAWSLLTKILQYDPLRGVEVKAPMVEIVADFLRLIGREAELEEMRKRGTLQETADWLTTQIGTFQELLGQLMGLFAAAWAAIQPENLPNLMSDLRALIDQVVGFLGRVTSFAVTVATTVLSLIKKALLGWLSGFAHEVPGFHLLTVILGRNPFTAEPVPRSAENIIKGFITLLPGGEAQYQQLAESGVVGSAAARIEGAMAELGISWALIRDTFLGVWNSLSIHDLVDPIAAFERIRAQFGVPIAKLFEFVKVVVQEIITLLLALMNFPTDIVVRIVTNAMQAWADIKRDPVGFLLNMLSAVKKGFLGFLDNILTYLLQGLTGWLFRGLRQAGIEPPKELTLETVLDLVMKVLGITTDKLWEKLAKRIGKDTVDKIRGALDKVEGIWTFVKDVQERGVAAIWEKISSQLTNLWDMVLQKVQSWIMDKIVDRVVAKLLSMLDPTGIMAVVNSFIAFFNAVQSAIEYLRDLLLIVDDYVSTIASVARGDVEPGAAKIERGLASAVPVAIGFLANQVGLGNIGDKIAEILGALRGVVDKAIDWLLDKAMQLGKAVLAKLGLGEESEPSTTDSPESKAVKAEAAKRVAGHPHAFQSADELGAFLETIIDELSPMGLTGLRAVPSKEIGKFEVEAAASPFGSVGMVLGHVEGEPAEALELALDAFSQETHAFVQYPGGTVGHYVSGEKGHAETAFLDDVGQRLRDYSGTLPMAVTMNINRTPCPVCAALLTQLQQGGKVELRINATNLYAGGQIENKAPKGEPKKLVRVEVPKTRMEHLEMMKAAGIEMGVWDIWDQIAADLKKDPALAGIAKPLVESNMKKSEKLKGWLANVRVSLRTPEWPRVLAKYTKLGPKAKKRKKAKA